MIAAFITGMEANGYVIHETETVVAIATGFERASENRKTGAMIQIWLLVKAQNPVAAVKSGQDSAVCFGCPLRGSKEQARQCYVNLGQAPYAIWNAWKAGKYPQLTSLELFRGHAVRFGAYGEPTLLPLPLLAKIAERATGWTGYTHRWANPLFSSYRSFLMASVDSVDQQINARRSGWRTFRVAERGQPWRMIDEISCPASNESGAKTTCAKTTCAKCKLCSGSSKGIAKSIVIQKH